MNQFTPTRNYTYCTHEHSSYPLVLLEVVVQFVYLHCNCTDFTSPIRPRYANRSQTIAQHAPPCSSTSICISVHKVLGMNNTIIGKLKPLQNISLDYFKMLIADRLSVEMKSNFELIVIGGDTKQLFPVSAS